MRPSQRQNNWQQSLVGTVQTLLNCAAVQRSYWQDHHTDMPQADSLSQGWQPRQSSSAAHRLLLESMPLVPHAQGYLTLAALCFAGLHARLQYLTTTLTMWARCRCCWEPTQRPGWCSTSMRRPSLWVANTL